MLFLYITLLGCLTLLYLWGNAACAAFRLGQPRNPFLVCWFGLFCLGVVLCWACPAVCGKSAFYLRGETDERG